jgi:hypothetical protein
MGRAGSLRRRGWWTTRYTTTSRPWGAPPAVGGPHVVRQGVPTGRTSTLPEEFLAPTRHATARRRRRCGDPDPAWLASRDQPREGGRHHDDGHNDHPLITDSLDHAPLAQQRSCQNCQGRTMRHAAWECGAPARVSLWCACPACPSRAPLISASRGARFREPRAKGLWR